MLNMEKGTVLFKVLDGLHSCNGGEMKWEIDKWYEFKGAIAMCKSGFHLTTDPRAWIGSDVYFALAQGIVDKENDKVVCRKVKLLCKCSLYVIDEYYAKWKPIKDEYDAKQKPIRDEYYAKLKLTHDEYDAKLRPIEDEYYAKLRLIRRKFYAKLNPLLEKYYVKCTMLINKLYQEFKRCNP